MHSIPPFTVQGSPSTYRAFEKDKKTGQDKLNPEQNWRNTIYDRVQKFLHVNSTIREMVQNINNSIPFPHFTVDLVFVLSAPEHQGRDIDNLIKPVVDTLFQAKPNRQTKLNREKKTGAFFPKIPDFFVYQVTACKRPLV